jgi:hypothetical protein
MRNTLGLWATLLILHPAVILADSYKGATERELLTTGQVATTPHDPEMDTSTSSTQPWYWLAFESGRLFHGNVNIRVRVWQWSGAFGLHFEAPVPHVIQIVDSDNVVLEAEVLEIMRCCRNEFWVAARTGPLFLYDRCSCGGFPVSMTYLYRIGPDLMICESGVFIDKADLEAEGRALRDMIEKTRNVPVQEEP